MPTETWVGAAGFIALVLGFTVYYTAVAWFEHREKMAKIHQGIDPDKKEIIDSTTGEAAKK